MTHNKEKMKEKRHDFWVGFGTLFISVAFYIWSIIDKSPEAIHFGITGGTIFLIMGVLMMTSKLPKNLLD